jgi:hypothetical protein
MPRRPARPRQARRPGRGARSYHELQHVSQSCESRVAHRTKRRRIATSIRAPGPCGGARRPSNEHSTGAVAQFLLRTAKDLRIEGVNMEVRALLLVCCVGCPATAFSQPYFSANVGWASADFPIEAPFNGLADDSAPTYGIDFGVGLGSWAVELGANGYGNVDGRAAACAPGTVCALVVTEESVDQTIYDVGLVRRFTIRNFQVYGKAGYYRANIDTTIPLPDSDFSERGLMLGVGARWYFEAPWSLSIEGTRYDDNVSQLSIGFGWGLGFKDKDRGFGNDDDDFGNDDGDLGSDDVDLDDND